MDYLATYVDLKAPDLDFLGSRDVIGHATIRFAVVDFLWVLHCDHASIWHRCRDMAPQSTRTHKHRTTNLIISSNVHYVHLAEIKIDNF